MFKRGVAMLLGLGLLAAGCGAPGRVLIQPTKPIKAYGKLGVQVKSDAFLASIQGNKNYDNYVAITREGEGIIAGHINNWAASNWNGSGSESVWVRLDLQEFNTGSGAAKLFLGSAANGRMTYKVTVFNRSETLAQYLFETQVTLAGNTKAFWAIAKQVEARLAKTN